MGSRGQGKGTLVLAGLCVLAMLLSGFRSAGAAVGAGDQDVQGTTAAVLTSAPVTASAALAAPGTSGIPGAVVQADLPGRLDRASAAGVLQGPLAQLAALGGEASAPGAPLRLVLKWQGEYSGGLPAEAVVQNLSARLGLGEVSRTEEDGHMTSRSSGELRGGAQVSLFWSELGGGRSYCIVTFETADLPDSPELPAAAEAAGQTLRQAGIAAEWNASLQAPAREQSSTMAALLATEQRLAATASRHACRGGLCG